MDYKYDYKHRHYVVSAQHPKYIHEHLKVQIKELREATNWRYCVYSLGMPDGSVQFIVNCIVWEDNPYLQIQERIHATSTVAHYIQVSPYFTNLDNAIKHFQNLTVEFEKLNKINLGSNKFKVILPVRTNESHEIETF